MAGSDSRDPLIPEWQRKSAERTATPEPDHMSSDNTGSSEDSSRSVLLDQATKFLEDESIRDASTDRKVSFLESKGLTNDEIQKLLGVSRNSSATSEVKTGQPNATESTSEISAHTESTDTSSSSSAAPAMDSSTPSRDVPPIITYPEFLLQPSQPPLLSLRSVLYTLYGAAGLGATLYGTSEFLVKPMLRTLTEARHELAETAVGNLHRLNEKLEQNVSNIPLHMSNSESIAKDGFSDEEGEAESITSDPTELFHRDIATQTSPDLGNDNTTSYYAQESSSDEEKDEENTPLKAVATHLNRLEVITSHLREFAEDQKQNTVGEDSLRERLSELHNYLDSLTYSAPSYMNNSATYNTIYNTIYTSGAESHHSRSGSTVVGGRAAGTTGRRGIGEEDAIATFKAEIRSVKGALLSARNFPSSRPVPAGTAR